MDYLCSECYAELEVEEDYRNNSQYTTTKKSFVVPCMCHTRQISRAEERVSDFKDELMDAQDKIGAMTKTLNKLKIMKKIIVTRDSLIDAIVDYEMAKYTSNMHIHLKINEDGELYIYEDTSYTISESEFNGGYPKVLKHSQGWGDYPEDYSVEDYDSEADLVDNLKSNIYDTICDLVDDEIKELKKDFPEISFED